MSVFEKMYSIGIRKKTHKADCFWLHDDFQFQECKIDCEGKYWLADPFLFEKDGIVYVFYEAYDLIERKGKIGYSVLTDNVRSAKINIVLNEPYHLSFPYIFEEQGDIYMMPESSGDYSVKYFMAKSFPDLWGNTKPILPDIYACDTVFVERNGKRWLIANEMYHNMPCDNYPSCYVKNTLFPLRGLEVTGYGFRIAEGDYGIRNGGKCFELDGKLYRVGQDCRDKQYGRGIVLFEIKSIEPQYVEEFVMSMDCKSIDGHIKREDMSALIGFHTYNSSENYEIIDYSQMKHLSFSIRIRRSILRSKHLLNRIINRLLK